MKNQMNLNLDLNVTKSVDGVKSILRKTVNAVKSTGTFQGIKADTRVLANKTAKVLMKLANKLSSLNDNNNS